MRIKQFLKKSDRSRRGQSFVELLLVLVILMMMLAGVVEYGFLINSYIHVLDGTREAARTYNSYKAFDPDTQVKIDTFYFFTAEQAATTMTPVVLNPDAGDDIIISVISLRGTNITRHPYSTGWSLCGNYAAYLQYYRDQSTTPLEQLSAEGWKHCSANDSRLTNADITARAGVNAMQSGLLVVEIIYHYSQVLKLPFFSGAEFLGTKYSLIPDPIPLYLYSIMPMSSAEPTEAGTVH